MLLDVYLTSFRNVTVVRVTDETLNLLMVFAALKVILSNSTNYGNSTSKLQESR